MIYNNLTIYNNKVLYDSHFDGSFISKTTDVVTRVPIMPE